MTRNFEKDLSPVEGIKARSNFLRGTIADGLLDKATGALADDDTQLSKFHGFYQQDDRDQRAERQHRKLEPDYSFMIRVRVPGGVVTPSQWLALDDLAQTYANHSLRLTTRQAFQFHGVIKRDLKKTIRRINDTLLDTIAACGDVNRNVMCTPLAEQSAVHEAALQTARDISAALTPRTRAYHEIWLDGKPVAGGAEEEPLYGKTYLPRKFKIAVVTPPSNDADVLSQDLGFIAVEEGGSLVGYNVSVGGGMGMSHGEAETYPRVADIIGFCRPAQAIAVAETVVSIQRDHGDRGNRKHARLKYTIDDHGLDWFRKELHARLGFELTEPRKFVFESRGDSVGWLRDRHGLWHLTLFVPQGRLHDDGKKRFLSAMRAIANAHDGEFRLTANQNVIISKVQESRRKPIETILQKEGITGIQDVTVFRQQALACVALPTCALAMAEAERYLPELSDRVEGLLSTHGLLHEPLSLRITGCPNGCARPYLAEIALVGKAPGRYNLFLGGDTLGRRLNRLYRENIDEAEFLRILDGWFARFARERDNGESFGDFTHRMMPAAEEVA